MTDTPIPQGSDTPALPERKSWTKATAVRLKSPLVCSADQMRALMAERDAARKGYADACKALSNAWAERDALRREVEARKPWVFHRSPGNTVTVTEPSGRQHIIDADDVTLPRYLRDLLQAMTISLTAAPPSADGGAT